MIVTLPGLAVLLLGSALMLLIDRAKRRQASPDAESTQDRSLV